MGKKKQDKPECPMSPSGRHERSGEFITVDRPGGKVDIPDTACAWCGTQC